MTQSIESMIEVLQAYKDGKKIEYRVVGTTHWSATDAPEWQFRGCEYRIAPEPRKRMKLEAWLDPYELRLIGPTHKFMPGPNWVRVSSEDKEILI